MACLFSVRPSTQLSASDNAVFVCYAVHQSQPRALPALILQSTSKLEMAIYLAERTLPGVTREQLAAMQHAAIEMSARFTAQGRSVRYLRSVFVPSESRCISLFEAENGALVRDVNEAAQLPFTRIVEAVEVVA